MIQLHFNEKRFTSPNVADAPVKRPAWQESCSPHTGGEWTVE